MQINIYTQDYENLELEESYNQVVNRLHEKKFTITKLGKHKIIAEGESAVEKLYRKSYNNAVKLYSNNISSASRVYKSELGFMYDCSFPLDLLCYEKNSQPNASLFSLQDSLDYILHKLTGCRISAVRNIKDYKLISRSILNVNFDELPDTSFDTLIGLDTNLDAYISTVYSSSLYFEEFVIQFYKDILTITNKILHSYARIYQSYIRNKHNRQVHEIVARSINLSGIVFGISSPMDCVLELPTDNDERYFLNINAYGVGEYTDYCSDICSRLEVV